VKSGDVIMPIDEMRTIEAELAKFVYVFFAEVTEIAILVKEDKTRVARRLKVHKCLRVRRIRSATRLGVPFE
jgi:hypothetical protein